MVIRAIRAPAVQGLIRIRTIPLADQSPGHDLPFDRRLVGGRADPDAGGRIRSTQEPANPPAGWPALSRVQDDPGVASPAAAQRREDRGPGRRLGDGAGDIGRRTDQ
jgi:hypothetical protein